MENMFNLLLQQKNQENHVPHQQQVSPNPPKKAEKLKEGEEKTNLTKKVEDANSIGINEQRSIELEERIKKINQIEKMMKEGQTNPFLRISLCLESSFAKEGAPNVIMCRAFAATLKGSARDWYQTLWPRSISSFFEMKQLLTNHFLNSRRIVKTSAHLMSMVQGEQETLKKFMHYLLTTTLEIRNLDMGVALVALTTALQPGNFLYSSGKKPPADVGEPMARAQKYINLEEMMDSRGNQIKLKRKASREIGEPSRPVKRQENSILHASSKFHRDHGHDTEKCIQLKNEIEALIKKKKPPVKVHKEEGCQGEAHEQKRPNKDEQEERIVGEIVVIFGGSTNGGDNGGARKRYAKQVLLTEKRGPSGKRQKQDDAITFDSEEEEGVQQPHDDALVVSLLVANYKVRPVLIDNGSSTNIIFWSVLEGMKIDRECLKRISIPLVRFGGDIVHPMGTITLPVTIGTTP
ncbi:uncharacterized protein LOC131153985 [Malania oleifera]|uniref:uncharacterized protein LOC131153985 n=1 Tax=Malania oleifera TaxID=397392 RepID=UPI0025AE9FB5|nr:uncharacterized protein LOC131153985 [Malania oleifera]